MRGSSDLYAFVDSLVALERRRGQITLSAEHRSAPALAPLPLELETVDKTDTIPVLRLACSAEDPDQIPIQELTAHGRLEDRLVSWLSAANSPQTTDSIRFALKVRKQRILQALHALAEKGIIWREGNRYRVSDSTIASLDEGSAVPIGSPQA